MNIKEEESKTDDQEQAEEISSSSQIPNKMESEAQPAVDIKTECNETAEMVSSWVPPAEFAEAFNVLDADNLAQGGVSEAQQTEEIETESKETAAIESSLVSSGEIAEASDGFNTDKSAECSVTNVTTENDGMILPETQFDTSTDFKMESDNLDNEETEPNLSQIDNEKPDVIKCDDSITMLQSHEMVDNSSAPKTKDEINTKTINQMETVESIEVNSESAKAHEEKIQEDVVRFENEEMSINGATEDSPSLHVIADKTTVNNGLAADSTIPKSGEESYAQISIGIELEQPISESVNNNEKGESEPKTNESHENIGSDVSTNVALVSEVSNQPENNGEDASFTVKSGAIFSAIEDMHCDQLDIEPQDRLQESFFDTSCHYAKTESSAVSSMFNDSAQMTEGMMDIFYYDI